MVNLLIWGIGGKMGRMLLDLSQSKQEIHVVGGVDKYADPDKYDVPVFSCGADVDVPVDVILDFSRPEALDDILTFAKRTHTKAVLATTGYSDEQVKQIREASQSVGIFRTSNFSLGITLLCELCRKAANFLGEAYDVEIIEQHHNQKVDAPSGTALSLAQAVNGQYGDQKEFTYGRHGNDTKRQAKEIGIHAVRGGTIVGKHEVMFIGTDEIVTLGHEAQSKAVFAQGALRAAVFMKDAAAGMYNMDDLVKSILA